MDRIPVETELDDAWGVIIGLAFAALILWWLWRAVLFAGRAILFAGVLAAVTAERLTGRRILPSVPGREGPPAHWLR